VGAVGAAVPVSTGALCDEVAWFEAWASALAFILGTLQAVDAARRSEQWFREAVDQASEVFYRQNAATGRFEYVSPGVEKLLGYTPEEMAAMDIDTQMSGIHPDDRPGLTTFLDDLVRGDRHGEKRSEREFRLRTKHGDYRWIHGTCALIRNETGVPRQIVGALTDITARLARASGVEHTIMPMTDDPVATIVNTAEYGEIAFQEYFVRYRWQPLVKSLRFDGIEKAVMNAAACHALENADIILIGPSNPWLSIDPILSVPGLRALVESRPVPRVAITPIVGGRALKGPAAKLMVELGYDVSPKTVVEHYSSVINGFVYDQSDDEMPILLSNVIRLQTIMKSENDKIFLAENVLQWIKGWDSF
jgi:PAS domain S-box-containing protein